MEATIDYLTPRYTPSEVLIVSQGRARIAAVNVATFHPAGTHAGSPIRQDLGALELQTAYGSRWYGCQVAYINSELRMVVIGTDPRDEVRSKWAIVPVDRRA